MKIEEYKTFQKDIDDIYENFIRAQKLFSLLIRRIEISAKVTADEVDAMDAAVDYFNRLLDDFDAVVNPLALPSQEVPA